MNHTPDDARWTRLDLEMYRDEALDEATAEQLNESLRRSPELRRRVAQTGRLDALARVALTQAAPTPAPEPPWRAALVGIACSGALLAGVLFIVRSSAPPARPALMTAAAATGVQAPKHDSMVVLSFPLPPARVEDPAAPTQQSPATPRAIAQAPPSPRGEAEIAGDARRTLTPAQFAVQLDAALTRNDAPAAAALLATTDDELRVAGYRRLGELLRSVSTARQVLTELPATEQLAACRELALEPRWRSVACIQLTALRDDERTREAVDALLTELSRSPELAPMVERVRGTPGANRTSVMNRSIWPPRKEECPC